jgi:hypothetical protein
MNLAFVCAKQDDDAWPDEHHTFARRGGCP